MESKSDDEDKERDKEIPAMDDSEQRRRGIRPRRGFRVAVTPGMMQEWDVTIKKQNQPAECPGCKTTRKRVHFLEKHVKSCKEAEALFTHICKDCNIGFLKDHMLANHLKAEHGTAPSTSTEVPASDVHGKGIATSTTTQIPSSVACGKDTDSSSSDAVTPRRGSRVKKAVNRDIPDYTTKGDESKHDEATPQKSNKQANQSEQQSNVDKEAPSTTPSSSKKPTGRPAKNAAETILNSPSVSAATTSSLPANPKGGCSKSATDLETSANSSSVTATPPPSTRPRGRPRKNAAETTCIANSPSAAAAATPSFSTNPKGRPRKNVTETSPNSPPVSAVTTPSLPTDPEVCPRKDAAETSPNSSSVPATPTSSTRPRGRPKKNAVESSSNSPSVSVATTPSLPTNPKGTPKKSAAETSPNSSSVPATPTSSTRPRGRPKKNAVESSSNSPSVSAATTPSLPTNPKGPPKKGAAESSPNSSLVTATPPSSTRPRGRPKKNAVESSSNSPSVSAATTPSLPTNPKGPPKKGAAESSPNSSSVTATPPSSTRPRGRPRKNAVETSSNSPSVSATTTPSLSTNPRGRPRNNVADTSPNNSSVSAATTPPATRPRGRPRKNAAETSTETATQDAGSSRARKGKDKDSGVWTPRGVTGKKKGKSKQKKASSDEEEEEGSSGSEEEVIPPATRPRGRPRKHAAETSTETTPQEAGSSRARKGKDKDSGVWTPTGIRGKKKGKSKQKKASSDEEEEEGSSGSEEEVILTGYTRRTRKRMLQSGEMDEEEPPAKKADTEKDNVDLFELSCQPDSTKLSRKGISLSPAAQKKFAKEIKQWEIEFETNKGSFAICPKCRIRRRTMDAIVIHYRQCKDALRSHVCDYCGRDFQSVAGVKYHLMAEHNTTVGKYADKDEKVDYVQVLKKTGRLKCPKDGCGKKYNTYQGFKYHFETCGTEINPMKCEVCGKAYTTQPGLRYHMIHSHPSPSTQDEESPPVPEDVVVTPVVRTKRRAASRALATLKEIDGKGKEIVALMKDNDKRIKALFTAPKRPDLPQDIVDNWIKSINETKEAHCVHENCNTSFPSIGICKHHYFICGKKPDSLKLEHICKVCDKVTLTSSAMIKHIGALHTEEIERLDLKREEGSGDSEFSNYSSDEDDEEDDDEEDDDDRQEDIDPDDDIMKPNTNRFRSSGKRRRKRGLFTKTIHPQYSSLLMLKSAEKWTSKQHNERFCSPDECIFQGLQSLFSDWKLLRDSEKEAYEPATLESVPFRVISLPEEDDTVFIKLQKYAVLPHPDKKVLRTTVPATTVPATVITRSSFFVGGPVWAMAWCPIPRGNLSSAEQYAVISCHKDMDDTHRINNLHRGPGLVQLWGFGKLTNAGATSSPRLCMSLAHDYGCVWDLKWCPSGCWQNPDVEETDQESRVSGDSRMGLLGMACSDGTVTVMSVLHPKESDMSTVPVYKPTPVLSLFPSVQHGQESAPWFGQCWCMEWLPGDQHNKIMACFSNGTVALWDLLTTSPLLQSSTPDDGKILYPMQTWSLCDFMIRSFAWCPLDPNYIVTVCIDKSLSIWDLRDPSYPVMSQNSSAYIDCKWLSHWAGFLTSTDNSIIHARQYSYVGYYECGYHDYSLLPTTVHKSCVWGFDVSDWLNALIAVDSGGDVEFMLLLSLDIDWDHAKAYHFENRRRSLYFTELKILTDSDKQKLKTKSTADNHEHGGQNEQLPVGTEDSAVQEQNAGDNTQAKTVANNDSSSQDKSNVNRTSRESNRSQSDESTSAHGASTDVAMETQESENDACVEIGRTGSENSQMPKGSAESDKVGTAPPVVIKTEPIDPVEYVPTNLDIPAEIPFDSQGVSVVNEAPSSDVAQRTNPSADLVVDSTNIEVEDEIAQLLQVCQQNLTDAETELATQLTQDTPITTETELATQDMPITTETELATQDAPITTERGPATQNTITSRTQNSALETPSVKSPNKDRTSSEKSGKNETTIGKNTNGNKTAVADHLPRTYSEMSGDYGLVYNDINMSHFANSYKLGWKLRSLSRLRHANGMKEPPPDQFPLQALYKTSINPNYGSHFWVLTAGQAGIVRAHCMVGLNVKKHAPSTKYQKDTST